MSSLRVLHFQLCSSRIMVLPDEEKMLTMWTTISTWYQHMILLRHFSLFIQMNREKCRTNITCHTEEQLVQWTRSCKKNLFSLTRFWYSRLGQDFTSVDDVSVCICHLVTASKSTLYHDHAHTLRFNPTYPFNHTHFSAIQQIHPTPCTHTHTHVFSPCTRTSVPAFCNRLKTYLSLQMLLHQTFNISHFNGSFLLKEHHNMLPKHLRHKTYSIIITHSSSVREYVFYVFQNSKIQKKTCFLSFLEMKCQKHIDDDVVDNDDNNEQLHIHTTLYKIVD